MTAADRRTAAALFILVFAAYAWFFGGGGWNQNASFDLTRAIVERRTFAIDAYRSNTYDVSFHGGHTYANKAPGLSFLAVPPYAALVAIERLSGLDPDSFAVLTLNLWLCTVLVCATSGAALAALLFVYARNRMETPAARAVVGALVIAFGTYVFAYSTVFFAHVPSALLLFWAFAEIDRPAVAGSLGGAAVLCSYAALPALVVMLAIAMVRKSARARYAMSVVAGGAPFALLLIAYQVICFGGPFRTAVDATSPVFKTKGALLGVFVTPHLAPLLGITISPFRGLFFLSPVLLLAIAGGTMMVRRGVMRRELAMVTGVVVAFLAVNVSFNNWDAGAAIGPRYILPVVPFLAVPLFHVLGRLRPLWAVLAAFSFATNFAVVAVNPLPSRTIADPIFGYAFPLLITGRLPAGVPAHPPYAWKTALGHVSVNRHAADEFVPFVKHPAGSAEGEWASFNVGEIVAPGSPLSLLPILLWIAGGSAWLVRRAGRDGAARARPVGSMSGAGEG